MLLKEFDNYNYYMPVLRGCTGGAENPFRCRQDLPISAPALTWGNGCASRTGDSEGTRARWLNCG